MDNKALLIRHFLPPNPLPYNPCFVLFFSCLFLYLRERQHDWGGAEREGDTESEASSSLWAVSTEPDAGLKFRNCEIMTWAEVRHSIDWATQAPHFCFLTSPPTPLHCSVIRGYGNPPSRTEGWLGKQPAEFEMNSLTKGYRPRDRIPTWAKWTLKSDTHCSASYQLCESRPIMWYLWLLVFSFVKWRKLCFSLVFCNY